MDAATYRTVWQRASDRCEYCRLPQASAPLFVFHVEHIRAKQHRGDDDPANLALACPASNRFKGPNLSAIDPETDKLVALFNPRTDMWKEHFAFVGALIAGRTPTGRATAALLNLNAEARVAMRTELQARGEM